jgi:hypothetical protein
MAESEEGMVRLTSKLNKKFLEDLESHKTITLEILTEALKSSERRIHHKNVNYVDVTFETYAAYERKIADAQKVDKKED